MIPSFTAIIRKIPTQNVLYICVKLLGDLFFVCLTK